MNKYIHDGKVLPQLIDDITIKQNKVIDTAIMDDGSYDSKTRISNYYRLEESIQQ